MDMLPFNKILVLIIFIGISVLVLQYSLDSRTYVRHAPLPKFKRKPATANPASTSPAVAANPTAQDYLEPATDEPYVSRRELDYAKYRKQQLSRWLIKEFHITPPASTTDPVANVVAVDPDGLSCVEAATDFPAYVCLHTVEDSFSRCMRRSGQWEVWTVNQMIHVLKQFPDMGVIDMGANVGMFAMTAAAMGRHVIAIEPRDDNVLRLRRAALLNHAEDRTVILQNVVGGWHYKTLFMVRPNPVQGRVGKEHCDKIPCINVTTVTPDDLLQHAKFKKAFVKIDIEGKETEALVEGGNKLFNEMEIPIVTLEWGWLGKSEKSTSLASFFLDRGYVPFSHHGEDFTYVNKTDWTWDMWFIHPSCPECMLPSTYVGPPPHPNFFPPRC